MNCSGRRVQLARVKFHFHICAHGRTAKGIKLSSGDLLWLKLLFSLEVGLRSRAKSPPDESHWGWKIAEGQ